VEHARLERQYHCLPVRGFAGRALVGAGDGVSYLKDGRVTASSPIPAQGPGGQLRSVCEDVHGGHLAVFGATNRGQARARGGKVENTRSVGG